MHKNFTHNVKGYYEDTDAGGVVYYANYLKYLERARTEALSSVGLSNIKIKNDFGVLIIVKSCNIEYKKSAKFEDILDIISEAISFTKTSIVMKQTILKNNELISEAIIHLVAIDKKGKPCKFPEELKQKF